MKCTRCKAAHTPENQLVSTEHGLLCPACLRVLEAAQGAILDPLADPYASLEPKTHYLGDAFDEMARQVLERLNAVDATKVYDDVVDAHLWMLKETRDKR